MTQLCEYELSDTLMISNGGGGSSQSNLFQPSQNPLTIPWGRLIPFSPNAAQNIINNNNQPLLNNNNAQQQSHGVGFSFLPRTPSSTIMINGEIDSNRNNTVYFMGLANLRPYDKFNEYVIGRSQKCDVVSLKQPPAAVSNTSEDDQKRRSWVHSMISNRHCLIYCMLKPNSSTEMDVYVEDSSGNGTLINKSILLRRGEKRLLHTGDEICLINSNSLRHSSKRQQQQQLPKDIQQQILQHYSYIFVNLHTQQQAQPQPHAHQTTSQLFSKISHSAVGTTTAVIGSPITKNKPSNNKTTAVNVRKIISPKQYYKKQHHQQEKLNDMGPPSFSPSHPQKQQQATTGITQSLFFKSTGKSKIVPDNSNCQTTNNNKNKERRIEQYYDLRDIIGKGTGGEVLRAIDRRTGEQRAVKVIATDINNMKANPTSQLNFLRKQKEMESTIKAEAQILQSLEHPYIVQLIDVFISSKAIYLVMELLQGGDLFDRIVLKGNYSELSSRRIMRRILNAVYYLHEERDVVHRDLKPENILLKSKSSDIEVKLTDFGLAKSVTSEGLKTFCGTPQYFAPEVLRRKDTIFGKGRYGKEADMWSLGVILYILLSGMPPFDITENGMDVVAEANIQFDGNVWDTISQSAKELVLGLLTADPQRRIDIREACNHEWILVNDGDTHTHPLEDPTYNVIVKKKHQKRKITSPKKVERKVRQNQPVLPFLTNNSNNTDATRINNPQAPLNENNNNNSTSKKKKAPPQSSPTDKSSLTSPFTTASGNQKKKARFSQLLLSTSPPKHSDHSKHRDHHNITSDTTSSCALNLNKELVNVDRKDDDKYVDNKEKQKKGEEYNSQEEEKENNDTTIVSTNASKDSETKAILTNDTKNSKKKAIPHTQNNNNNHTSAPHNNAQQKTLSNFWETKKK